VVSSLERGCVFLKEARRNLYLYEGERLTSGYSSTAKMKICTEVHLPWGYAVLYGKRRRPSPSSTMMVCLH